MERNYFFLFATTSGDDPKKAHHEDQESNRDCGSDWDTEKGPNQEEAGNPEYRPEGGPNCLEMQVPKRHHSLVSTGKSILHGDAKCQELRVKYTNLLDQVLADGGDKDDPVGEEKRSNEDDPGGQ